MRVFVAVEVPDEVRGKVHAAARELLDGVRAAKPVAAENLHVTVRFVGEVDADAMERLVPAVRAAAIAVPSATARVRGFGVFPDRRRPRVVWAGVEDPAGACVALESEISKKLAALGYSREERPYSAHLTVARMRDRARDVGALAERLAVLQADPPAFGEAPVESVTIYQSELGRNGPRYTALARLPLAQS
jgi:2'-5' RNA ligase